MTTVDSIIPCQKEFNNNQADDKKQETILVDNLTLYQAFPSILCVEAVTRSSLIYRLSKSLHVKHVALNRKSRTASKKSPFMLRYQTTKVEKFTMFTLRYQTTKVEKFTMFTLRYQTTKVEKFTMFTKILAKLLDLKILAEEPDKITDMLLDLENIHLIIDVMSRCVTDVWIEGTVTGTAPNERNEAADVGAMRNGAGEEEIERSTLNKVLDNGVNNV